MLRPNERLLIGTDPEHAARLAADMLIDALAEPDARGDDERRSIALAGGSTPALLYATLTRPPWREKIERRPVNWFWGDERAVPPDHPDSNYRMAMETLLDPLNVPAERIHRMEAGRPDLEAAAADYERTIRQHLKTNPAGVPAFDVILLGIGTDGHTASLFPGSSALTESRRLVAANYAPGPQAWRMTLTYPLLQAAGHIVFLVTGESKAEVLRDILSQPPDAGTEQPKYPAVAVRAAAGRITWILDQPAARLVAPSPPE